MCITERPITFHPKNKILLHFHILLEIQLIVLYNFRLNNFYPTRTRDKQFLFFRVFWSGFTTMIFGKSPQEFLGVDRFGRIGPSVWGILSLNPMTCKFHAQIAP